MKYTGVCVIEDEKQKHFMKKTKVSIFIDQMSRSIVISRLRTYGWADLVDSRKAAVLSKGSKEITTML